VIQNDLEWLEWTVGSVCGKRQGSVVCGITGKMQCKGIPLYWTIIRRMVALLVRRGSDDGV
jgi:hypothetical protein